MSARHGNRQKYENPNPIQRALIRRFQRQVVRLVQQVSPQRILDVGCGEGFSLRALQDAGIRAEMTGIDLDAQALEMARAHTDGRCQLERVDATTLAARGQTYDLVMMLEVLEHIDAPRQMLPILASLTHGPVLLSVPREPFFRGLNLLRGRHVWALGNDPEHVNHWGRRGFFRFLASHFELVEAPPVFPWTLALCRKHNRPP